MVAALCWGATLAGAARPNVLVILTDDQRWDALGVVQREQGAQALFPWFPTPHLDRLAAEGARFANAFVTTSLCSPSRASLLSGRYARSHQVLNNFTEYNRETQFPYTPNVRGVRTDDWKLIRYPHGDGSPDRFTAELYHLADDPFELRNLIDDPRYADKRRELERELARCSKQAGPDRMPVYQGIVNVLPKY